MYRPLSHTGGLLTHIPQPTITISLLTGQSVEIEYSPALPLPALLATAAEQFNLDPRKIVILNNDEILKVNTSFWFGIFPALTCDNTSDFGYECG